jgi:hypothetical protein
MNCKLDRKGKDMVLVYLKVLYINFAGHVAFVKEMRNALLDISRLRWEDSINIDMKEINVRM